MKALRRQARVTAFLRKSLAKAPQEVLKLEAMARTEGLLGEKQRITHAKPFKRGKHSLRIIISRGLIWPFSLAFGHSFALEIGLLPHLAGATESPPQQRAYAPGEDVGAVERGGRERIKRIVERGALRNPLDLRLERQPRH